MNELQKLFKALEDKLDRIYGKEHSLDFQKEFDALKAEVFKKQAVKPK